MSREKMRLAAPKPYRVRPGNNGNGTLTIPSFVFLFTDIKINDRLWFYANGSGELVLTKQKVE